MNSGTALFLHFLVMLLQIQIDYIYWQRCLRFDLLRILSFRCHVSASVKLEKANQSSTSITVDLIVSLLNSL